MSDFSTFAEAEDRRWPAPYFEQGEDHPAVNISWEDANQFCAWLTRMEREDGLLPEGWQYRLPTEEEWMLAASLPLDLEDAEFSIPEPQDLVFAWGSRWPPPPDAGNFSPDLHVDDFEATSPVGTFEPNPYGIYDLSGNVWEWCSDFFEGARDLRVLKGGSFRMREVSDLVLTSRVGNVSYLRLPAYGFRVVIETR